MRISQSVVLDTGSHRCSSGVDSRLRCGVGPFVKSFSIPTVHQWSLVFKAFIQKAEGKNSTDVRLFWQNFDIDTRFRLIDSAHKVFASCKAVFDAINLRELV
jgi:hypothetical protein